MSVDRRTIPGDLLDQAQREYASVEYTNKIYTKYYSTYEVKPFISKDRELYTDWEEQALIFPNSSIIPLEMMTKFEDGLLPGHIYMLHWITNVHRKRIPSYFEYKYGINFATEKQFLLDQGYLDQEDHLTCKGADALNDHKEIIANHSQKTNCSKKVSCQQQILNQKNQIERNGFEYYQIICQDDACDACRSFADKHFKLSELQIGINAPPFCEHCKCSIAAWDNDEEYEKWLDSKTKKKGSIFSRIKKMLS